MACVGTSQYISTRARHETHLPTVKDPSRPHPRISGPHENPWGSRRHQRTPRQGSQASGRLIGPFGSSARTPGDAHASPGRKPPRQQQHASGGIRVQRLTTRAQFQAVLAGVTVARSPHFALHRLMLDAPASLAQASGRPGSESQPGALFVVSGPAQPVAPWIGVLLPKRWARRAVTRNTIRRQVYAVGALYASRLAQAAHVVRLRQGFDRSQFISASSRHLKHAVRVELEQLLARACP